MKTHQVFLLFLSFLLLGLQSLNGQELNADFFEKQRDLLDLNRFSEVKAAVAEPLQNSLLDPEDRARLLLLQSVAEIGLSTFELNEGRVAKLQSAIQALTEAEQLIASIPDSLSVLPMGLLMAEATLVVSLGNPEHISEQQIEQLARRIALLEKRPSTPEKQELLLRAKLNLSQLMIIKSAIAEAPLLEVEAFIKTFKEEAEAHFDREHNITASLENNLGYVCLYSGRFAEARDYFICALDIWETIFPADHFRIGDGYDNLAYALMRVNDYEAGERAYKKGLAIRKLNYPAGHVKIAHSSNNLGLLAFESKKYHEAALYLKNTLKVYKQTPGIPAHEMQICLHNLATTLGMLGRVEEALPYHYAAIQAAQKIPHSKLLQAKALEGVAQTFRHNLYFDSAVVYVNKSMKVVGFSPGNVGEFMGNLSLDQLNSMPSMCFAKGQLYLQMYVQRVENLNYLDSAWTYCMYGWDFLRLQQMSFGDFSEKYNILERTALIPCHISVIGNTLDLDSGHDPGYLEKAFLSMEMPHATLLGDLFHQSLNADSTFQRYAYINELFPFSEMPGYKELQRRLFAQNPDASVIEYVVCDGSLLTMVMTPDSLYFHHEGSTGLEAQVEAFRLAIQQSDKAAIADLGYRLYDRLIAPLDSQLSGKHIYIIPDHYLHNLPFETLLTTEIKPENNYSDFPFWIKKNSISYGPSIQFLTIFEEQPSSRHPRMIAVCPTDEEAASLGLLSFTGAESLLRDLAHNFGAHTLLGKSASEEKVKANWDQYSIIHLAMHVAYNQENALRAYMQLYPDRRAGHNGRFYFDELLDQSKVSDLVVLQGCGSDLGSDLKGEGVVSLAAGLSYTGCPSFIASLWEIDETASSALYKVFYDKLTKGKNKAEALREAQLEMIASHQLLASDASYSAAPMYWAGIHLTGNTQALFNRTERPNTLWGMLLGGSVLLLGFFFFRRKNKTKS